MGSATEAMERIIQNLVRESSHHFVAGSFAQRFAEVATGLGKRPSITRAEPGTSFDLDELDIPDTAELIAVTQNETSAGTSIDPTAIERLRDRYPDRLIAVDIVSSAPYVTLDIAKTDCTFLSVQKGFGLPSGLGVLIASPRTLARSQELLASDYAIGSYHSFPEMAKFELKNQTSETPNILGIYLLGAVSRDFLAYGPSKLRQELAHQSRALYEFIDLHPAFEPLVTKAGHRSHTVLVAAPAGGPAGLMDSLSGHDIKLGSGYGSTKATHIRIANFPAHVGHADRLISLLKNHSATTNLT
jgi:phosphoserine aminotransferase